MKKITLIAIAAAALLAGCNTVSGLGQDVKAGGQAVSNTAQDIKAKM